MNKKIDEKYLINLIAEIDRLCDMIYELNAHIIKLEATIERQIETKNVIDALHTERME